MYKFTITMLLLLLFSTIKTDEEKTDCDQFKECEQCEDKCHFVIWKSAERRAIRAKCVDISLSESEVKKQGPYGNEKNNTHWEMSFIHNKTECKQDLDLNDKGTCLYLIIVHGLLKYNITFNSWKFILCCFLV